MLTSAYHCHTQYRPTQTKTKSTLHTREYWTVNPSVIICNNGKEQRNFTVETGMRQPIHEGQLSHVRVTQQCTPYADPIWRMSGKNGDQSGALYSLSYAD